jgi:DNA polymerase III delta' subunit
MPLTFDAILGQPDAIDTLRRAYLADRLPHGLLFAGPAGVGKGTTARALAGLFLCEKPHGDRPCGRCESCRVFEAGNHPDYHLIYRQLVRLEKKDAKARDLPVSVIREYLVAPAAMKPVMGRGKVFVVEEAELMNAQAQNSMLKTLEEPAGRTAIVLLTDQPGALLPTIRSRCQTVRFGALGAELVSAELRKRGIEKALAAQAADLADGSLGVALRWIEDDVIGPATELAHQLDGLFAGRSAGDLAGWFKKAAEAYAERQLKRDELGSKDQATREGMNLYLRLAAEHARRRMAGAAGGAGGAALIERACAVIDAVARAETYLDANVNVALILQQLSATLDRQAAG